MVTKSLLLTQHNPVCSKVCGPARSTTSWVRPRTPRSARTPHARDGRWPWAGTCLGSAADTRRTRLSGPYLESRGFDFTRIFFPPSIAESLTFVSGQSLSEKELKRWLHLFITFEITPLQSLVSVDVTHVLFTQTIFFLLGKEAECLD